MSNKHPTILIVEDERDVALSMEAFLEERGYAIVTAGDGGKGLEKIRGIRPDAVLLDLRMPVMDGLDILKHTAAEYPEMPVIVVSGKGRMMDVVLALRLGAWDYLIKPLDDMEVLAHSLARALDRARLLRENRMYREHLEEEVQNRTAQLELANQALQGKHMALREVLGMMEEEKKSIGEQVVANVERIIIPLVRSLKEGLSRGQQKIIEQLEAGLAEIVSPFTDQLSREVSSLTPAEVRICNLIRNGLGVKEIAGIEHISPETVGAHRRNIRRKLGVANKKVNLTTYLQTLMKSGEDKGLSFPGGHIEVATREKSRSTKLAHSHKH
ncbi:MAG TPA: response regulator [Tepidisphaeraceae bacterium]|jgi:DNA-binding NarL/FixJ family response regulator|nr:response regulator [Tepidisphaeraceae bacterium]